MLLALTSIIACSLPARGFQLQSRTINIGPSTSAVCGSDFSWAFNSLQLSPCYVAAQVNAPCNQGNWYIPALNVTVVYTPPSSSDGTANPCTCSWASYNLISACTDCQGSSDEIASWSEYSFNCAGLISDITYYPANITLLSDTLIPFWAITNPASWPNEQYNSASALVISNEGNPDVGGGLPSSSITTSLTSSSTTISPTVTSSSTTISPTSSSITISPASSLTTTDIGPTSSSTTISPTSSSITISPASSSTTTDIGPTSSSTTISPTSSSPTTSPASSSTTTGIGPTSSSTTISSTSSSTTISPASSSTTTGIGPTSSSTTTNSKPIGAIVGGVVGGVAVLLGAIILGIFLFRRTSRAKNVTDPFPLLMQRLSSSTAIRTNLTHDHTSSIGSFPFFSSSGSTLHSMRQQMPPPVAIQRDETAVEPFILAPSSNYNPYRKQADGSFQTPSGRTKYDPPAYTELSNAFPEAGGSSSSRGLPPAVSQAHRKESSISGSNTSLNVLTGHRHQLSGDRNSDIG